VQGASYVFDAWILLELGVIQIEWRQALLARFRSARICGFKSRLATTETDIR
jgi:hypothetical protein